MTYRLLRSVHPFFAQLTHYQTPKILCFTIFSISAPSCGGIYTSCYCYDVIHVPWTHLTQHPKLHLSIAVFSERERFAICCRPFFCL